MDGDAKWTMEFVPFSNGSMPSTPGHIDMMHVPSCVDAPPDSAPIRGSCITISYHALGQDYRSPHLDIIFISAFRLQEIPDFRVRAPMFGAPVS